MTNKETHNQAFVDGQNLYMNTKASNWIVDLKKFRVYLKDQYHIDKAYYFLGAVDDNNQSLYELIQEAGFILIFREHSQAMVGKKKGNVDTDIVFTIMAKIAEKEKFDNIVLVSGDGDYYKMVKFLVEENKLCKILMPVKGRASSLYRQIPAKYRDYLDKPEIKKKIELK